MQNRPQQVALWFLSLVSDCCGRLLIGQTVVRMAVHGSVAVLMRAARHAYVAPDSAFAA